MREPPLLEQCKNVPKVVAIQVAAVGKQFLAIVSEIDPGNCLPATGVPIGSHIHQGSEIDPGQRTKRLMQVGLTFRYKLKLKRHQL